MLVSVQSVVASSPERDERSVISRCRRAVPFLYLGDQLFDQLHELGIGMSVREVLPHTSVLLVRI